MSAVPRLRNDGRIHGGKGRVSHEMHYHRGGSGWRLVCGVRVDEGHGAPKFTSDIAVFRRAAVRCKACESGT